MGKRHEGEETQPTKKQELRDARDTLVIENQKPKLIGGKRRIVDETYKDTAEFKDGEVSS